MPYSYHIFVQMICLKASISSEKLKVNSQIAVIDQPSVVLNY